MKLYYEQELKALKRAGLYRKRELFSQRLYDYASNDYLGLSVKKSLFKKACKRVKRYRFHSSKASAIVNGYHPIHKEFEEYISKINGFEKALCVGSGFLANLALLEALPRRRDLLLIDEEYHASGILATKLNSAEVKYFRHNDPDALKEMIFKERVNFKRVIVAVEGIYSMSGDLLKKEIFDIADEFGALLIVDEAHSVGVLGDRLLGIFDYYNIAPRSNHIKMGTLGKALGSYGAYILCSNEIYEYLCNRAKSIIYATAISPFDIALAYEGFLYIEKNIDKLKKRIKKRQNIVKEILGIKIEGLILKVDIKDSDKVMKIKKRLLKKRFLVGAIRPPTVKKAMIRVIPRLKEKRFKKLLKSIKELAYEL